MPTKGVRVQRDPARPGTPETLTVTNAAAVPFASDLSPAAIGVLVGALVENTGNGNARYFFGGTAPTTTAGHRLLPGQTDYWNEFEVRTAQIIAESANTDITMTPYAE